MVQKKQDLRIDWHTMREYANGRINEWRAEQEDIHRQAEKKVRAKKRGVVVCLLLPIAVAGGVLYYFESAGKNIQSAIGKYTSDKTTSSEEETDEQTEITEDVPDQEQIQKNYVVTADTLNVRESADANSNKVAKLTKRATCQGTGNTSEDGAWIEIYYNDAKYTGWVSAEYLSESAASTSETQDVSGSGDTDDVSSIEEIFDQLEDMKNDLEESGVYDQMQEVLE